MTFGCSCAILDDVLDAKNLQLRDSKKQESTNS